MTSKRKVKVITSVLATTQNSLTYPECRRDKDAQKEQLNKKLNRILVISTMEIEKQNIEFDQRFKFKLDEIEQEIKKTRDRLVHYQKELSYSRYMTEWFKQKPPNSKRKEKNEKVVLPYINTNKDSINAKRGRSKKILLKNEENVSELKKEVKQLNKDTLGNEEIAPEELNKNDKSDKVNYKKLQDCTKEKGMEYEIKFSSDRSLCKKQNPATFLQRNYKRNKERILYSYLMEKKQFQHNQTKCYNEQMNLIRTKLKTHNS